MADYTGSISDPEDAHSVFVDASGNKQINVLDLMKYTDLSPNFQSLSFQGLGEKKLNNPIDCPSAIVNQAFNELHRCSPEKQQSSRWEKPVRRPAEPKLLLKLQFHDGSFIFRTAFQQKRSLRCLPWFHSPWSTKSLAAALLIKSSLWTEKQAGDSQIHWSLRVSFSFQCVCLLSHAAISSHTETEKRILSKLGHRKALSVLPITANSCPGRTGDRKQWNGAFKAPTGSFYVTLVLWPFPQTLAQSISGYSCGPKRTFHGICLAWPTLPLLIF